MLQVHSAPAALAHWIDGAVIVRLGPGPGVSRFPALPHAMLTMRLARPAGGGEGTWALCPPITFHTLTTQPVAHAHEGSVAALGLLVRPGAAACLLGHASGALVDQVLPWAALAGEPEADRLAEAVDRAGTDMRRLRALMDSLDRTLQAVAHGRDPVYERLCAAVGSQGVLAADTLGLGRRQLERRCQAVLGVAPKQYQRIVRFHRALAMAVAGGPSPMAGVAVDAGFYDQSHLARDARQLAGASIGRLVLQARPDAPWWPLATRQRLLGQSAARWPRSRQPR
jgi:AraC-like DNA-binding protein